MLSSLFESNPKMSCEVDNDIPELDYDMWEGQFEFLGPNSNNVQPYGLLKSTPFLPHNSNGIKKTSAHTWCDNVADNMQLLQQQVGVLQDTSMQNDERYTRVKSDNAALQARINMLEEQLRDTELRYEDRLQDEQRRAKEALLRLDREKELHLENCKIRLQASELEANNLREEVSRQRVRIEKLEDERRDLSNQLQDMRNDVLTTKEKEHCFKEQEKRLLKDHENQSQLIDELSREVERLRADTRTPALPTTSPETLRLEELHEEMADLRIRNQQLEEANDELQASLLHASVEQGRLLTAGETSLAAELEEMTHDESAEMHNADSFSKIQQALKEQQDVNAQLRAYIDGILLNIVENYPQLLEVKHRTS